MSSITSERRAALIAQADAIAKTATAERRDLTPDEETRFNALMSEVEGGKLPAPFWKPGQQTSHRDLREGEVRYLKPEERMADLAGQGNPEGMQLGRMIRGLAIGDWRGADAEKRAAQNEGTNSAGGYLVPTPIASEVIDLARANAVCFKAGARTVPMESSSLSLPRLTTDAPAAWKAETAAATTGTQVFDRVLLLAKTLYTLIPFSLEIMEDVPDFGQTVEAAVAKAIALGIDQAALYGSGTGATPAGILTQASVGAQHAVTNGATPTYDMLSTAVDLIHAANFEPNAVAMAPRTYGELDRLKDSQQRYLAPPTSVQNLKLLPTSSIGIADTYGTASTASKFYMGDFTQMVIGMRHELSIEILREGFDGTYSGAQQGVMFVRAYVRADVALRHPQAFVYMDGLL